MTAPRSGNAALAAIRGRRAISLVGCLILLPVSVLGSYAAELRNHNSVSAALWVVVFVSAVDIAVIICVHMLLRSRYRRPVPLFFVLASYAGIGAVRPVAAWWFDTEVLGLQQSLDLLRVVQTGIVSIVALGVIAVAMEFYDRQRGTIRQLQTQESALNIQREQQSAQIAQYRTDLDAMVTAELDKGVDTISRQIDQCQPERLQPGELRGIAKSIRNLSEQVVRPISHRIADDADQSIATVVAPVDAENRRGYLAAVLRDSLLVKPFSPIVTPATHLLIAFGAVITVTNATVGTLGLVVEAVVICLVLMGAQRTLTPERLREFSVGARAVAVVSAHIVAILVGGLIFWAIARLAGYSFSPLLGVLGVFTILLLATIYAVIAAAAVRQERSINALEVVVATRTWEVQRLAAELTDLRTRMAQVLHGDVQSQLTMLAMRLGSKATALEDADASQRAEVQQKSMAALEEAHDCIEQLRNLSDLASRPSAGVRPALTEASEVWAGVMDVRIDLPEQSEEGLDSAPRVATAVVELAGEAITNAAKHGAATQIDISIRIRDGVAVFDAVDNGSGPSEQIRSGYGLSHIVGATANWSLTSREPHGAHLHVEIPAYAGLSEPV